MAHGEAREEKWRGKRRMEWVASTHALYGNTVYPALLPLMRTPRLPAADWTDTPADINGLVRFAGRPNLVSARVPSHSVSTLPTVVYTHLYLLMMGLDMPETCRGCRNILRKSCASSCFFFTQLYRDARSTKHKKNIPEDGQCRLQHVGGVSHVCNLLCFYWNKYW